MNVPREIAKCVGVRLAGEKTKAAPPADKGPAT